MLFMWCYNYVWRHNRLHCDIIMPVLCSVMIFHCSVMCFVQNLIEKLEKLQNQSLRTILGAPRWTRILTMLQETGLLSVSDRLKHLQVGFAIKVIKRHKRWQLQSEFLSHMKTDGDTSGVRSFSMRTIDLLKHTLPGSQLDDLRQDLPYQSPPLPWKWIPANFNIITPEGDKSKNNPWDLHTDYFDIVTKLNTESDIVIYTDGSINEQGRAGSAYTKVQTMSLWVNNGVSTLQT